MSDSDLAAIGRAVVSDGRLHALRVKLGFSATYMAEVLGTNAATYRKWEAFPATSLWGKTALRVGRFYVSATAQMRELAQTGVELRLFVPLHQVAPNLGLPHEVLLQRYRDGEFEMVDLGILGLWVRRDYLDTYAGQAAA